MATITAAAGGGNWNVGSTWVGGVVPLTTDDVVLDATSGQVTISATAQCKDINFSGYTNTITFNANLTITGNLTRNTSVFSYAGTFGIIIAGTTTQIITTTSVAWTIPVTFGGASPSISINGAFNINAPLTLSSTTSPVIARANVFDLTENVHPSDNITISGNGTYTGSANIVISGSNNQTLTASGNHQIRNNLTIDKTGGVLTLSGTLNYNTGTLSYVASGGTVNAGTSTLSIRASTTLNTNGITWNNFATTGTGTTTITLSSNLTWSGTMSLLTNLVNGNGAIRTVTFSGSNLTPISTANMIIGSEQYGNNSQTTVINFPTSSTLSITNLTVGCGGNSNVGYNTTLNNVTFNISGNFTTNFTNQNVSRVTGTSSQINMVGTGTITQAGGNSVTYLSIPININTIGTITILGIYYFETTVTYTSGTIVGSGTSVFITCTLNLNTGGKWGTDVIIRGNTILTSNATFGNLTTNTTAVAFSGAFTINVEGNLAINVATSGASTPIVINGTGSQSWTHGSAVYLSNSLTINKASGTLTLGTNVYYRTGTLTYNNIGGTVDTTTTLSTLNIGGNTTLNTNGITWYNFAIQASSVLTLSSDFTWSNNWTIPAGYTVSFAVSAGNLTPTPTANLVFTNAALVTLKNDITVNNVTRNGGRMNNNKVNIIGNLSIVTTNTVAGTTIFEINGTGNQTWTSTAYLVNPMIINKPSGTLTMGNIVYHSADFTYTQGNVDFTTNNNAFWAGAGTYVTTNLTFNTFVFASFGANSITLGSDLYANTFTAGGNGAINGLFNIYSQTLNINNSVSGASTVNITFNGIFYCNGDCTFSGRAGGVSTTNASVYVGGSCFLSGLPTSVGSSNLYMVGNGVLSLPIVNYTLQSNVYFNTSGKITIIGNLSRGSGTSSPLALTMNLIRGNVDARKATLSLGINVTHNLTNMNKIVWGNVVLINNTSLFPSLIMNEFFCGDATTTTNITLSNTSATALNAIVTFTDNFEKIAKFVNVNGVTFTRPQQLLLLTNQPKKSRNRGIRYNNDLPNGAPKGDPSVQNLQTVGQTRNLLLGDPTFIKTI